MPLINLSARDEIEFRRIRLEVINAPALCEKKNTDKDAWLYQDPGPGPTPLQNRLITPCWIVHFRRKEVPILLVTTGPNHHVDAGPAVEDRHNTGGFTSGEHTTGDPYDPSAIETCCTVAWIDMSINMLKLTGNSRVADEIELSTFNGNIGKQSPSGSWWTYNTPMDGVKEAALQTINFQCRPRQP